MRTLVLNAGYEPMQLISWQRALCLVFSSKAEVVARYESVVRTVSNQFELPSVVRLKRYVRMAGRLGRVRCTRRNVLIRDRYHCQYCGIRCAQSMVTIDHVIPRSKGGKTTWNNVVAACPTCNRKKGSRSLKEVGMKLRTKPKRPSWTQIMTYHHKLKIDKEWLPFLEHL